VRTRGSPKLLEYRRLLATQCLLDGDTVEEVANFLGIDASSVRRWRIRFQLGGWRALLARPVPGRPAQLSSTQEKIVRRWLTGPATEHGFTTELWTGPRLARVISEEFGVRFHPDYLGVWMRRRGFSPQKPQPIAQERCAQQIATWLERDWPRIKKKPLARMPP
jgi:transposase